MALLAIGGITLHQIIYTRLWIEPLDVVIYPINADGKLETHNYINTLNDDTFKEIDEWFSREAKRFGVSQSRPIRTSLGDRVKSSPPALPTDGGIPRTILWGLHLRYWVFRNTPDAKSNLRRIRVFVAYYQGEEDKPLSHSVGLQRGLIGVVHSIHMGLHSLCAHHCFRKNMQKLWPVEYPRRTTVRIWHEALKAPA